MKKYSEDFSFLILRILELFANEVRKFLKKWANFWHILLSLNVCKETLHISYVCISHKVKGVLKWMLFWYKDEDIDRFSNLH